MNQRDMTREQLEDALRLAKGEAEQYRREAMAFRWLLKVVESIEKEIADESKGAQITEAAEQSK